MDDADLTTLLTALMALPLNGILLLIVITLWRRVRALTEELVECHKQYLEQRIIRANDAQ